MNSLLNSQNSWTAVWTEILRRDPADAHAWAMLHRRVGSGHLRHLPALADIARDRHPMVVVMKSAQVGVSELGVNLALHAADTALGGRGNVLFAMPTQNVMDDFAQARFDRAIQDSPYLRGRLQPEPPNRKGADSKRLKRIGNGYLYLRGTDSTRQVASIDADLVILDEYDQMAEGILSLARKRLASSRDPRLWVTSTPRYPEAGIHELFRHSDQCRYLLPCRRCGVEQPLTWAENVDSERCIVVCRSCREPMDVLAAGHWEAQAPGNDRIRGYQLGRLYMPWADIGAMVEASQASGSFAEQEFYNSDLGEPFVPAGGGLTLDELDRSRGEYTLDAYSGQRCCAGVDVGRALHVVIREVPEGGAGPGRLWFAGLSTFDALGELLARFNVNACAIDAQPETYAASRFAERMRYPVALVRYDLGELESELVRGKPDVVRANRTQVIDAMVDRVRIGASLLPANARALGEHVKDGMGDYYRQLLAPQRVMERDASGNARAVWREGARDDHYAHAEVYCLLAARHLVRRNAYVLPISITGPSKWR